VLLEAGEFEKADMMAYSAMLEAARGLIRVQHQDASSDPQSIVEEFRKRFYDTQLFWDKYAGGKFAQYLFHRHEDAARAYSEEAAHHLVEETQLFIEAAHACHARMLEVGAAAPLPTGVATVTTGA
jgi:sulfite reductase (ferredoxin)